MKEETAKKNLKEETGRAVEWNGRTTKYVVVSNPGYYGFFTRAGAESFLQNELKGKGDIQEIVSESP